MVQVVKLGYGCVNLGSATSTASPNEQVRLIHRALDAGVTTFDTSDAYGSGASERLLGKALRNRRDEAIISTKGGYVGRDRHPLEQQTRRLAASGLRWLRQVVPAPVPENRNPAQPPGTGSARYSTRDHSPAHMRKAIHASLRRLGTDHVDVYHLHGPIEVLPHLLVELEDLRRTGAVGRWGVGTESTRSAAAWCDIAEVDVIELAYGVLDPEPAQLVFPVAAERSVELWARGVLGGGILGAALSDPSSISAHPKRQRILELTEIAETAGMAIDELAVRWVARSPLIGTMLLGMSSEARIAHNLHLVGKGPLPDDVMAQIDAVLTVPGDGERA